MPQLKCLMSRNRFEAIGSFFHVVTLDEETQFSDHHLKKILPLNEVLRKRCFDLYQPLQELSVDERMVKSKARSHMRQYIKNKPTKWGFKFWVISDPTGYTIDFDVYAGVRQTSEQSGNGLCYDVVMKLVQAFMFQGYELYIDNFYSSPQLFQDLQRIDIRATGTVNMTRKREPDKVKELHSALEIAAINSFILYKLLRIGSQRLHTKRHFRDQLVIQIIKKYGLSLPTAVYPAISSTQYHIRHGSTALLNTHRRRCAICSLKTTRNCPDCPFSPALCQNIHKDCHGSWHSPAFDKQRRDWFIRKRVRVTEQETPHLPSKRPAGRPRGSTDKKKRKKRGKKR